MRKHVGDWLLRHQTINWALVDQSIVSGASFLTIALSAHFLSVGDQGKLGYVLAWYMACSVFSVIFIFQFAAVEAPRKRDKTRYHLDLAQLQLISAIALSLLIGLMIVLLGQVSDFTLDGWELMASILFLFFQSLADFKRRSSYVFADSRQAMWVSSSVYLVRVIALLLIQPESLFGVLVVMLLASVFPSLSIISLWNKRPMNIRSVTRLIHKQWAAAHWLVLSGPFMWLWSALPVFLLGTLIDVMAVGIFITIRSLAAVGNVLMELLETQVAATLGKSRVEDKTRMKRVITGVLKIGFVIWGAGLVLCLLLGEEVIAFIFGSDYAQFSSLLVLLWLANGVVFLYRLNGVCLRTIGEQKAVMAGYVAGVGAMGLTAFLTMGAFHVYAAAIMMLIGSVVVLIGQMLVSGVRPNGYWGNE